MIERSDRTFHNAFLTHDDVEDVSEFRRGGATLFQAHGVPVAINAGDASLPPVVGTVAGAQVWADLNFIAAADAEDCLRKVQELFLVGGYSFNSIKTDKAESRRVEFKIDFWGLAERKPPRSNVRAAIGGATTAGGATMGGAATIGGASFHDGTPSSVRAAGQPSSCTSAQCAWLSWCRVNVACNAL